MRIEVLVLNPDLRLAFVVDTVAHDIIDFGPQRADQFRADPRHDPGVGIVQPDDHDSARFHLFRDMGEGSPGVVRVMKDTVGYHDIEGFVLDGQIENIHLGKGRPLQLVALLVLHREAEARQRQIDAQRVIVVELEEMGQLPRAAAAFEDELVVSDGIEKIAGEGVGPSLVGQRAEFFQPFIARERMFFVERAHHLRDRRCVARTACVQEGNAVLVRIELPGAYVAEPAFGAFETVVIGAARRLEAGQNPVGKGRWSGHCPVFLSRKLPMASASISVPIKQR